MDSNLLKIFVVVSNNKSISLGAKALNFTQSNVTLRIKQLEKTIDYQLFHRTPKGVKLTYEGEKLYPYAVDIVKKVEEATLVMRSATHQKLLKIGSTQSNAAVRLIPFITHLNDDFPNMKIELFTNTTVNVLNELLEYKIDIAFLSGNPNHKDIKILKEYKEDIFLVEPKKVLSENMILGYKESCAYFIYLTSYLRHKSTQKYTTTIFENYETILGCIKQGMGISLLPKSIIEKFGYTNQLKLTKLDCKLHTHLICRNDSKPVISEYLEDLEL